MNARKPAIIVGGICLAGKTTLVNQLKNIPFFPIDFVEGDDLHTKESIEKMRLGRPLNEEDRNEWKEKICEKIKTRPNDMVRVIACSALMRQFRDDLRKCGDIRFIFFVFDRESAENRAKKRLVHDPEHYYQPAIYPKLLDAQYRDLQIPNVPGTPGSTEEDCYVIDLEKYPSGEFGPEVDFVTLVPRILVWLNFS